VGAHDNSGVVIASVCDHDVVSIGLAVVSSAPDVVTIVFDPGVVFPGAPVVSFGAVVVPAPTLCPCGGVGAHDRTDVVVTGVCNPEVVSIRAVVISSAPGVVSLDVAVGLFGAAEVIFGTDVVSACRLWPCDGVVAHDRTVVVIIGVCACEEVSVSAAVVSSAPDVVASGSPTVIFTAAVVFSVIVVVPFAAAVVPWTQVVVGSGAAEVTSGPAEVDPGPLGLPRVIGWKGGAGRTGAKGLVLDVVPFGPRVLSFSMGVVSGCLTGVIVGAGSWAADWVVAQGLPGVLVVPDRLAGVWVVAHGLNGFCVVAHGFNGDCVAAHGFSGAS